MKQTAVEWLAERLESITEDLFNQAKQMEKEQIIESVVNTVKIGTEQEGILIFTNEDEIAVKNHAEQYYNETFKSE